MKANSFRLILIISMLVGNLAFCLFARHARADDANDTYDPFIDYNDYEVADEEEADINFFKNGRLLTAAVFLGDRSFTGGLHSLYSNNMAYGAELSYFFDLRFALQFSFTTSSHAISLDGGGLHETGNVTMNGFGVDVKYYFNTQNVSKGLAAFNPYLLGGFTSLTRTSTVQGEAEFARDSAVAFDAGLGFEVPILQKKMYVGGQGEYQIANFSNQYTEITMNNGNIHTGIYPYGDIITFVGIIGINF